MEIEPHYNTNSTGSPETLTWPIEPTKPYLSNEDESLRLFESDSLEKLTKVHPLTPLIIFVPIISFLIWRGAYTFRIPSSNALAYFLGGLTFWTLFEYTLHRFVFHFESQKYGVLKKLHFLFHGIHHAYPRDSRRLVMPPTVSLPLAGLVYLGCNKIMPESIVPDFLAGFLLGYLFYDMIHYGIHHANFSNPIWQAVKKHHYRHHYSDKSKGFGVSTALWDYIFKS
jgi:4-hydroxysphinganine ceramide fatty acyl 2-hydroxylase